MTDGFSSHLTVELLPLEEIALTDGLTMLTTPIVFAVRVMDGPHLVGWAIEHAWVPDQWRDPAVRVDYRNCRDGSLGPRLVVVAGMPDAVPSLAPSITQAVAVIALRAARRHRPGKPAIR